MRMTELNVGVLLMIAGLGASEVIRLSKQTGSVDGFHKQGRAVRETCKPSQTVVNGRQVCQNDIVFEDNFDELDETKWRRDKMIANGPDYEFVFYDTSPGKCFVKDGILHLKPTIPENIQKFSLNGHVDLRKKGCTGDTVEECKHDASSYNIVPPVISARIRTSQSFSFKYGVVEVRAKLPDGNWLYPQIWLEPVEKSFYGPGYSSGRIVIATSRGNGQLLTADGEDIGSVLLMGGLIISPDEPERYLLLKKKPRKSEPEEGWTEDFHTYKLTWRPDGVIMSVDGEEYGAVSEISPGGFGTLLDTDKWSEGTNFAPFDREFYITLGVGAGGIRDFPDNTTVGDHPKPWKNKSAKAKLDFLKDIRHWKESWAWEEAALQVDYIKVWAL